MSDQAPADEQKVSPEGAPLHPDPIRFLHESGLLFEINRRILHPLGYALAGYIESDGSMVFGGIVDATGDPDGMAFEAQTFAAGVARFEEYMRSVGSRRHADRIAKHGLLVQASPGDFQEKKPA